ncbi:hypothetical protein [Aurantimonas sp. 22II-16-19i]|uniref:hypothetical protein n=1 Tax=Aurantimonas sp. 22II-16-19i TaxID=1317114 RepID=UPI0009F7CC91|nr:hypothetical protein [Aurantimonas sp. 22II-16-19i]ORE90997.1 hypothetical protein ATO4_20084 [Aurantimonas sp. 22II-16-19i]
MLTAEAMRLAAYEALCPTAALAAGTGFPTLAGDRVFDSRAIAVDELDDGLAYTPSISLYTEDKKIERRGPMTSAGPMGFASASLAVVCDLAVSATDEGETSTMPLAGSDPKARLVLASLVAQVRQVLTRGETAAGFRMVSKAITEIVIEPFILPEMGLRWHREIMTLRCDIADDDFGAAALPTSVERLRLALPAGSYARGRLDDLAAYFTAPAAPVPLATIGLVAPVGAGDAPQDPDATPDAVVTF